MSKLRIWPWFAAIISGVLLGLCYPKHDLGNLVWIWQLPLLAALWFSTSNKVSKKTGKTKPSWRRGFALGYLSGLVFFLINVDWLFALRLTVDSTGAGLAAWISMAAYLALYFGLFGAFAASVGRWNKDSVTVAWAEQRKLPKWLAPSLHTLAIAFLNAAAWCGIEWLRGTLLTGFGWNGLGVALHNNLAMIQAAELVGVTGLAFTIVFASCVALATIARFAGEMRNRNTLRPHLDFAVAISLVIGQFLFGLSCVTGNRDNNSKDETVEVRAVLIQLNLSIKEKWDRERVLKIIEDYRQFTELYTDNENANIDLVIWPETAIPGRFTYPWVQDYFTRVLASGGGDWWLLTGQEHEDPILSENPEESDVLLYNDLTAMRGSPENFESRTKVHLVPFGEYLPFRKSFPPMNWILGKFIPGDFERGKVFEPIQLSDPDIEIIPQICFEDTVGRIGRKFIDTSKATTGPQILVTVTNNGWFWDSSNIPQHLANAKFRAIELRRPMARCANTGVSCFINEYGGFTDPSDPSNYQRIIRDDPSGTTHIRGTLPATLKLRKNPPVTLYAKIGDAFSVTLGLIALSVGSLSLLRARRKKS